MAKLRQRVTQTSIEFVEMAQAGMIITRSLEDEASLKLTDIAGAFIKVQPKIRSSERASVDSKAIRERLIEAGAAAVIVAPVIIPDSIADAVPVDPASRQSPQQHLEEWFASVQASKKVVKRAIAEALASLGDAGL